MRIGWVEVVLILAIILIIFGPGKLPGLSSSIGKAIRNFKIAIGGRNEGDRPEKPDTPADNLNKDD